MNINEIQQAQRMLRDRCSRLESMAIEGPGNLAALTAYWSEGGQTIFYRLEQVEEHLREHPPASLRVATVGALVERLRGLEPDMPVSTACMGCGELESPVMVHVEAGRVNLWCAGCGDLAGQAGGAS